MLPYLREKFGNPSSSHPYGVALKAGIEQARERVAALLGCTASEIIFTSGATESNNMVIKGIAKAAGKGKHFITSEIEHPAVLEPCRNLERFGYSVTYLPVNKEGMVNPVDLEKAITPNTALVTIMHSNNEVGTIQDIPALAKIASSRGILFHTDAAQSVGKVRIQVEDLGVDFLTIAGHKFYAPKGIGALYIKGGRNLLPMMHGAGHERGLRPGTENAAFIVGLGAAGVIASEIQDTEGPRQMKLGRRLFGGLKRAGLKVHLNGHPEKKLPNTWNISFEGFDSIAVMEALTGIAVSPQPHDGGSYDRSSDRDVSERENRWDSHQSEGQRSQYGRWTPSGLGHWRYGGRALRCFTASHQRVWRSSKQALGARLCGCAGQQDHADSQRRHSRRSGRTDCAER
jgi:cysteine desulfurase